MKSLLLFVKQIVCAVKYVVQVKTECIIFFLLTGDRVPRGSSFHAATRNENSNVYSLENRDCVTCF